FQHGETIRLVQAAQNGFDVVTVGIGLDHRPGPDRGLAGRPRSIQRLADPLQVVPQGGLGNQSGNRSRHRKAARRLAAGPERQSVEEEGGFTRKHTAYNAGRNNKVNKVAMIRPPMMATAMGPQKALRDSGIIASTAVAAVSMMGRARPTAASTMAVQTGSPSRTCCSIWSTRMTEL